MPSDNYFDIYDSFKPCRDIKEPDYEGNACDMVNHPSHYTVGGVETLDVIEAKLSQSEFQGYCLGNILKYLMRAGYKGKQLEDLKKAQFYLNRMIDSYESSDHS